MFFLLVAFLSIPTLCYGLNQQEAVKRCEVRFESLKAQEGRLSDPAFKGVFDKVTSDMQVTIDHLKKAKTAPEVFSYSNTCHNGARSLEWLLEKYGQPLSIVSPPKGMEAQQQQLSPEPESLLEKKAEPVLVNLNVTHSSQKKVAPKKNLLLNVKKRHAKAPLRNPRHKTHKTPLKKRLKARHT